MYLNSVYNREFPAIYRGIVEDNKDPQKLGRCRVRVPAVYGELRYPTDMLPWARPIVPSPIGTNKGSVNIPDKGDIVWVMFEGSNRDYPLYIGGTYGLDDKIPVDEDKVYLHLDNNSSLSYDRKAKKYTLKVSEKVIEISEDHVSIESDTEMHGDLTIVGSLAVRGNLSVGGTTNLNNLYVSGYFNRECDCVHESGTVS